MSQIFRAANLVRELEPEDIRILTGIELGMRRFNFVPLEQISFYARINRSETQFRLDKLHRIGILQRNSQLGYIGYQLITESYDVLALKTLVQKDILSAMGEPIGRGKESDVFFGKTPDGEQVAVKIHRIGQNSFRKVRQLRSYAKDRRHMSWLYMSRLSAESEYEALQKIEPLGLNTPVPIAQNRHMVVMSLIQGNELSTLPEFDNPIKILDNILNQVERFFVEAQIIHCDLSEFNIIITPENDVLIIDWPQWEAADHPNASAYLARDLLNVQRFFKKHYDITFDVENFMDRMIGTERSPTEDNIFKN